MNTIEGFKRGYGRRVARAQRESDKRDRSEAPKACLQGSWRFLRERWRSNVGKLRGYYSCERPTRAIYIPCGRCEVCRERHAKRKAAKVFDWLRAISSMSWGRGICLLVTFTLSAEDGPRRGKAGRDRLAAGVSRLKTELRRQLRFGNSVMLSVRSYEFHKDGALHGHVVFFVKGPWMYFDVAKLRSSYAEGIVHVSQRALDKESVSDAFAYAMKYVMKGEVVFDPELKGTRWYSIYSRYHRLHPRVSQWVCCYVRHAGKVKKCLKVGEARFLCGPSGSVPLAGLAAAQSLTALRASLIRGLDEAGWRLFYSPPPESSNVLLRCSR